MTLGELIKEYTKEHSMAQFINDSTLSKAYVYMLINNKNNTGEAIVPSIETIKKAAKGMHSDFDSVFNKLDYDFVVSANPMGRVGVGEEDKCIPDVYLERYITLDAQGKENVLRAIDDEVEACNERKRKMEEILRKETVTSISDARTFIQSLAAYGGIADNETIIRIANEVLKDKRK